MTLRVAIGGFGAIGKVVAQRLDQGIEGLTLAAVAARDIARAEAAMVGFARKVPLAPLARLWETPISSSNAHRLRSYASSPSRPSPTGAPSWC